MYTCDRNKYFIIFVDNIIKFNCKYFIIFIDGRTKFYYIYEIIEIFVNYKSKVEK